MGIYKLKKFSLRGSLGQRRRAETCPDQILLRQKCTWRKTKVSSNGPCLNIFQDFQTKFYENQQTKTGAFLWGSCSWDFTEKLHLHGKQWMWGLPCECLAFSLVLLNLSAIFQAKSQTQTEISSSRHHPAQVTLDPISGSGKVPEKVFGHPWRSEGKSGKTVILFMKLN